MTSGGGAAAGPLECVTASRGGRATLIALRATAPEIGAAGAGCGRALPSGKDFGLTLCPRSSSRRSGRCGASVSVCASICVSTRSDSPALGWGELASRPVGPPLCHGRLCCRDLPWLPPLCPPAPPDDRISPALLRQRRLAAPSPKRPPTNKERTSGTRLSPSTTSLRHATRPPRERTAASRRVRGTSSATPARPRAT